MAEKPKTPKWQDPEYKRNYFKEYYHKNKTLKNKPRVVERENWTKDPELRMEYLKNYKNTKGKEKYICEVCQMEVTKNNKFFHLRTKIHTNALKILGIQQ